MLLKPRPIAPKRRLTPADLGVGMTVCISVVADRVDGKSTKLIMVADTLLSMDITSTTALKARALSPTWSILMAGDDVTYAESVISSARKFMGKRTTKGLSDAAFSMAKSYQEVRRTVVEEQFLSPYNQDIVTFLGQSPDYPSPDKRKYLLDKIEEFDL